MLLFEDKAYDRFFNPLSCKNRRIYYECIRQLIEKSKQVTLLYENDARDTLILYFRNLAYAVEDEENSANADENISSKKSESENASAVLKYFRHCGWLADRELGRNGDNIAAVKPYCRRLIDSIDQIFNRDNSVILTNHIFSIYDILNTAFDSNHARNIMPYSSILVPVSESVAELKNELLDLKDNIRTIMQYIIKITETNEMGKFLIRDEMMKKFFSDYFFIKKDGLIPGYIQEIEIKLNRIMKSETYEKMIREYQEKNKINYANAREVVEGQFAEIKSFISYDYVKEIDYIDKKINKYYNLYSTRILMVLSNNVNMQTYLNNVLMTIKDMNGEDKNKALNNISKCFELQSYKYIGRKSIERRKKKAPNTKSVKVIVSSLSEEEKTRLTNELLYDHSNRYGVNEAAKYFEEHFNGADIIEPNENTIKTRDDAMMIAAGIIYSDSDEFPYETEFLDGTIENNVATISKVRIKRKDTNE